MTLVVFDFDETLTATDLSVLLGREYDRETEIQGLATQSRRGEVDVADSLRQRVSLLEGMPIDRVARAFERAKLRPDAAELLAALQRSGVEVGIITHGFEQGVSAVLERAGLVVDHLVANRLVVENESLTGEVEGPLLEWEKDQALEEVTVAAGVDLDRTVVVGNDASDIPMLHPAGIAIGYQPEPLVEQFCDVVVTSIRNLQLYLAQHGVIDTEGNST